MKNKTLNFLLVLLSFLTLIQCQSLTQALINPPTIEFKELKIVSISFDGLHLMAVLEANNPNPTEIQVDSIDYQLSLAEVKVLSGVSNKKIQLTGQSTVKLELPLELKYKETELSINELLTKNKNNYLFQGKAKIGFFEIPFSKEGKLAILLR